LRRRAGPGTRARRDAVRRRLRVYALAGVARAHTSRAFTVGGPLVVILDLIENMQSGSESATTSLAGQLEAVMASTFGPSHGYRHRTKTSLP
jgi:hypothetical protein